MRTRRTLLTFLGVLLCTSFVAFAQTGSVRGIVSDAGTNEPLMGVTVLVKGTANGGVTDTDGGYLINNVPAGTQTLVFSYLGYKSQELETTIEAGKAIELSLQLSADATSLDEVVLTGLRRSQLNAINAKKNATNSQEVLTTNDLGRLPDINVAEATQRIAGVSIETDGGEGRFISIRGIQPSLVNVTMNNGNLASTSSGRETPLNMLPIEMISSIEVQKTVTPDMEGTAIGGSVNINTLSAFDKAKSQFLVASIDGLYTDQQVDYGDDGLQSRLAVTAGKRFGKNEKFGVVFSGNYYNRDFSQSVLDPDRWQLLQGTDSQGNLTPGYLGPNEIEIQIEDNERERFGFTADLEYRPNVDSKYFFRTLYTHTNEMVYNSEFELTVAGVGELTDQTPTSGYFDAGSGELDLSNDDSKQNLYSYTLGLENRYGNLLLSANGTYSHAKEKSNGIDGTFENSSEDEPLLAATYDTSNYFFDIIAVDQETARDPSLYRLRNLNFRKDNLTEEDMYEGSLDLKYDINLSAATSAFVKVGGRFRSREKQVDRSQEQYSDESEDDELAPDPYRLDQFAIIPPPAAPVGGTDPNVHGDAFQFTSFFSEPASVNDTSKLFFLPGDTEEEIYADDINYREEVSAAYAMANVDTKFMNIVGGFRIEHTKTTSSPFVDQGEGFEPLDFENSYTNFMPSINVRMKLTDNFITRLAWTNTIGRANYDQLAGTSELEVENDNTDGTVTGTFTGANPDLKPYESMNFDLSLEYYFTSGGLFSVGGFYKNIDNQIFEHEYTQDNIEFEGMLFDVLSFEQYVNLNSAKLWGFEASYDQTFTFLPGFWSGFGLTANMAILDSEVEYPGREDDDLPLLRQPDFTYNIIPYFQKYGFEVRAAITHRSEFLTTPRSLADGFVEDALEINPNYSITDFDQYEDSRTEVDLTLGYTFPSGKVKILAQARNVTNAEEIQYQGNKNRYDRYQTFGASYFLGASFNF